MKEIQMQNYYLSICGIVRNEAPYIEEWIEFHLIQGVQHFFLYENDSTDATWEILKRYEEAGIATIEKISGVGKQRPAYDKCLKDHGKKSRWIAFLDCDEFLSNSDRNNKASEVRLASGEWLPEGTLRNALKDYEEYPALAVNWLLFGSGGYTNKEEGLVIDRFRFRSLTADKHVKSIVQPALTISTGNNAHYFKLIGQAVNEHKEIQPTIYYWIEPNVRYFKINHYHVKSKQEYFERKAHIDVDNVDRGDIQTRFMAHDINQMYDPTLSRYTEVVKNSIQIRRRLWSK